MTGGPKLVSCDNLKGVGKGERWEGEAQRGRGYMYT